MKWCLILGLLFTSTGFAGNDGCSTAEYRAAKAKGRKLVKEISPNAQFVRVDTWLHPRYGCIKTLVYTYGQSHFELDFD